ncbi:hypothetical protein THMIRHAM_06850 [Thiomicrorhabdus immobilis]|uniref:Chemotaxis protein n=1 Tax=Thiomicrorhabdus immobilis TaxID=2791037 RepID=A0ABN6CVB1_9GAMM|nr:hypothetical protein [Thiomicrorhabdus immobilis]BCN92900.1 hypothetical protein THMIRHAM_06850 [Thiomicrorhabdus immobilis]
MSEQNSDYVLGAKEVQQTILVLNLSIAQIDLSITEGDNSVNTLIDSFTFMSHHIEQIQQAGNSLAEISGDGENVAQHKSLLLSEAGELSVKMQQAIIAFQFYDKLSQRLEHVSHGLTGLAEIVSHEMRVKNEEEWEAFKTSVRKGTTMREEEELFELIFDQHVPTEEAIEIMKDRMRQRMHDQDEVEEEVEFF